MNPSAHICVCICTCRRAEWLRRLLRALQTQQTGGLFSYSIVVADNDAAESARAVVAEFSGGVPVKYCVEAEKNIALVRNRALAHADGDYIAFIDDDEFPVQEWLLRLHGACVQRGAAGALGPVVPHYETEPPRWVRAGGFHERPRHETGFKLDWTECRTGNVIFARKILDGLAGPFRAEFGTAGEDMDFFRRLMAAGHQFIWCDEAVAYETVPPLRWSRRFMLKRALLRGGNYLKHPEGRAAALAKSVVAVPVYALVLPFAALAGQHHFMKFLIRWCDHAGRLLAVFGVALVKERPM